MSQSSTIIAALLAAFVLFVAALGHLGNYTAVLWGATEAPPPSGSGSSSGGSGLSGGEGGGEGELGGLEGELGGGGGGGGGGISAGEIGEGAELLSAF